jgi:hypothetical protein
MSREIEAAANGLFRFGQIPVGRYSITVSAEHFSTIVQQPITLNISQSVRLQFALEVSAVTSTVTVESDASLVDTSTNALGAVVTGHEILELPLNGRNFTQLGLLQSGVAPLTPAMAKFGGSLRANQAYAVNGMRPESNNYLVDGSQNVDRLDGAFALKPPVDAIEEFRILTLAARRSSALSRDRPRASLHAREGTSFMEAPISSSATMFSMRATSSLDPLSR